MARGKYKSDYGCVQQSVWEGYVCTRCPIRSDYLLQSLTRKKAYFSKACVFFIYSEASMDDPVDWIVLAEGPAKFTSNARRILNIGSSKGALRTNGQRHEDWMHEA